MPSYAASHPSPPSPLSLRFRISLDERRQRERERKIERFVDRSKGMVLPPEGEIKRERGRGAGRREGAAIKEKERGCDGGRTVAS